MTARRFPPQWTIEEHNDDCFIVKDHNGHALAYVYFEDEPGRRAAANLLTRDEARRIPIHIAKLPDLLRKQKSRWPLAALWVCGRRHNHHDPRRNRPTKR
jgi:hypothetical protein